VLVGVPEASVQRTRFDGQTVFEFGDGAAQGVDLGSQRREPVGLVSPQVPDAGDAAGAVGQGGEGDQGGGELSAQAQVEVDTRDLGATDDSGTAVHREVAAVA